MAAGDLALGAAFEIAQHDALALVRGQRGDGGVEVGQHGAHGVGLVLFAGQRLAGRMTASAWTVRWARPGAGAGRPRSPSG